MLENKAVYFSEIKNHNRYILELADALNFDYDLLIDLSLESFDSTLKKEYANQLYQDQGSYVMTLVTLMSANNDKLTIEKTALEIVKQLGKFNEAHNDKGGFAHIKVRLTDVVKDGLSIYNFPFVTGSENSKSFLSIIKDYASFDIDSSELMLNVSLLDIEQLGMMDEYLVETDFMLESIKENRLNIILHSYDGSTLKDSGKMLTGTASIFVQVNDLERFTNSMNDLGYEQNLKVLGKNEDIVFQVIDKVVPFNFHSMKLPIPGSNFNAKLDDLKNLHFECGFLEINSSVKNNCNEYFLINPMVTYNSDLDEVTFLSSEYENLTSSVSYTPEDNKMIIVSPSMTDLVKEFNWIPSHSDLFYLKRKIAHSIVSNKSLYLCNDLADCLADLDIELHSESPICIPMQNGDCFDVISISYDTCDLNEVRNLVATANDGDKLRTDELAKLLSSIGVRKLIGNKLENIDQEDDVDSLFIGMDDELNEVIRFNYTQLVPSKVVSQALLTNIKIIVDNDFEMII